MISIGEELERENPLLENSQLSPAINLMETQQPIPDDIVRNDEEDLQLLARARAVGVQYEFAQHGASETEQDRRRRRQRNQRRVSHEEGRLREVVGDLPPPPLAGSSQVEDNAYSAIRAFEVEQMTYTFSCCEVCKERRLECKGTRNMCTRCRRDKKIPKVWSEENNMDAMSVPEILSGMSHAEQMLIARLAPTVHVHMLKHGGIASKGHCIAFPQAVQEPAEIIRVRRQGKDDTHKD